MCSLEGLLQQQEEASIIFVVLDQVVCEIVHAREHAKLPRSYEPDDVTAHLWILRKEVLWHLLHVDELVEPTQGIEVAAARRRQANIFRLAHWLERDELGQGLVDPIGQCNIEILLEKGLTLNRKTASCMSGTAIDKFG
jgi:hypothetical protein